MVLRVGLRQCVRYSRSVLGSRACNLVALVAVFRLNSSSEIFGFPLLPIEWEDNMCFGMIARTFLLVFALCEHWRDVSSSM